MAGWLRRTRSTRSSTGRRAHGALRTSRRRKTLRISLSPEGDGAFAVVGVDTLWQSRDYGSHFHWKGRACKVYARVGSEWKMTMHTGLLAYPPNPGP